MSDSEKKNPLEKEVEERFTDTVANMAESQRRLADQQQRAYEEAKDRYLTRKDQLRMNAVGNAIALFQKSGRPDIIGDIDEVISVAYKILAFTAEERTLN
jgi:hypothetical protein